ncbi:hypothetical protein KG089_05185 [Carnobacteriaceae bacterium zg-ZUI252]|nr:hypothetical protein [Carnobacteriaceae bacterium zg-ZUI252]
MIDFRKIIRKSLLDNEVVLDFLAKINGVPNLSFNAVTNAKYPLIVYTEINTIDAISSGNNVVDVYETRWQVSIFSEKGANYKVKNAVDEQMHKIGFKLYGTIEMVEPDTKINHTVLRYSQTISKETFETLEKQLNI